MTRLCRICGFELHTLGHQLLPPVADFHGFKEDFDVAQDERELGAFDAAADIDDPIDLDDWLAWRAANIPGRGMMYADSALLEGVVEIVAYLAQARRDDLISRIREDLLSQS